MATFALFRWVTINLCLNTFLVGAVFICESSIDHHQGSYSDLHDLVLKLAKRGNCESPEPNWGMRLGSQDGPLRETSPPMLQVWKILARAFMAGFGCADQPACPGKPTCNQLIDRITESEPMMNERHERHAMAKPGRFSGDLYTYPVQDPYSTGEPDSEHHDHPAHSEYPHKRVSVEDSTSVPADLVQEGEPLMYDAGSDDTEDQIMPSDSPSLEYLDHGGHLGISNTGAIGDHPSHVHGHTFQHPDGSDPGHTYHLLPPHPQTEWWIKQDQMRRQDQMRKQDQMRREGDILEVSSHQNRHTAQVPGNFRAHDHDSYQFHAGHDNSFYSNKIEDFTRPPENLNEVGDPAEHKLNGPFGVEDSHRTGFEDSLDKTNGEDTSERRSFPHSMEMRQPRNRAKMLRRKKGPHDEALALRKNANDRARGKFLKMKKQHKLHHLLQERPERQRKMMENLETATAFSVENFAETRGYGTQTYSDIAQGRDFQAERKRSHGSHKADADAQHGNSAEDRYHNEHVSGHRGPAPHSEHNQDNHKPMGHNDNHYEPRPSSPRRPSHSSQLLSLQHPPQEPDHPPHPPSPFNHSSIAMRILFAGIGFSSRAGCEHGLEYLSHSNAWVDRVCSEVESEEENSEVLSNELLKLDNALNTAFRNWDAGSLLKKTMGFDADDSDFRQHRQCFNITHLVNSRPSHIENRNCHPQLHDYLERLSTSIFVHLLQGHHPLTTDQLCSIEFAKNIFSDYGIDNKHSISVEGLQTILDRAQRKNSTSRHWTTHTVNSQTDSIIRSALSHHHVHSSRYRRSAGCTVNRMFSAQELVDTVVKRNATSVNLRQFYELCPSLLQQILVQSYADEYSSPRNLVHSDNDEVEGSVPVSALQTYGLGTASVAVITLCALLGALGAKIGRGVGRHYAMAAMFALAVGNLCGDAILHLVPEALVLSRRGHGVADGDDSACTQVHHLAGGLVLDDVRLKCLAFLASVYLFWLLEIVTSKRRGHVQRAADKNVGQGRGTIIPMSTLPEMTELPMPSQSHDSVLSSPCLSERCKSIVPYAGNYQESSGHLMWMIVVGDAVHNLADGLAIGAAFAHSVPLGLSTSMAVVCHDIPHELGDFAVLLSTGMKLKKALLVKLLSALTAFVGLYVGLSVSAHIVARQWIFIVVAGMFLYVAMADLIPELIRYFCHFRNARMFIVQSVGLLTGFVLMFLLVLLEAKLNF